MSAKQGAAMEYTLGHADFELERLERQGQFLSALTRDVLVRAGIGPGMRVLDFGAGAGDVSLLASELVGPGGEVVAVERSAEAVGHARLRLAARGIRNIRVVQGDESAIPQALGDKPLDAVVGRLVLVHQADPVASFLRLARFVRPGGIVAFHEVDLPASVHAAAGLPMLERAWRLINDTMQRAGMASDVGATLKQAFDQAGITCQRIVREGLLEGSDSQAHEFISRTVRSFFPAAIKHGTAAESKIDLESFPQRMKEEASRAPRFYTPMCLVAAFGRTALAAGQ